MQLSHLERLYLMPTVKRQNLHVLSLTTLEVRIPPPMMIFSYVVKFILRPKKNIKAASFQLGSGILINKVDQTAYHLRIYAFCFGSHIWHVEIYMSYLSRQKTAKTPFVPPFIPTSQSRETLSTITAQVLLDSSRITQRVKSIAVKVRRISRNVFAQKKRRHHANHWNNF